MGFAVNSTIKNIQRGITAASGTVTITAVNMAKTTIKSNSKGSAGTVAATGTIASTSLSGTVNFSSGSGMTGGSGQSGSVSGTVASTSISGGTTNLTTKVYSAVLTNSTTITCDGPVEWEVTEHA